MTAVTLDLLMRRRHKFNNTLHTWLLVGGSLLLLVVCAYIFMGGTGIFIAIIFGLFSLNALRKASPKMVLKMYKARPLQREEFPFGFALIDELSKRAELPATPKLYVVPSKMMNAFAVGRREDSAIAFTDALVRALDEREFAGVMAHEVTHIQNEDVKVMAIADMVHRFTSLASSLGMMGLFLNIFVTSIPWLGIILLMAAPTIGGLIQRALSRTREYDADLGAAFLTGDPEGLAKALLKLEKFQKGKWEGMVLPGSRIPDPSLLRTHPKTDERVARLRALIDEDGMLEQEFPKGDHHPKSDVDEFYDDDDFDHDDDDDDDDEDDDEHVARADKDGSIWTRTKQSRAGTETRTRKSPTPKPVRRSSPAPKINRQWGRKQEAEMAEAAEAYRKQDVKPVLNDVKEKMPKDDTGLAAPEKNPRVHVTRGGVYW